jgi:hypothetical protein
MKNIYFFKSLFLGLLFIAGTNLSAQDEMVFGGDMETADDWTIVDLAAGNGHIETFGYTEDTPTDGTDGCLSLTGSGDWSNVAVCQELYLEKGVDYVISMQVKTSINLVAESNWVEIVLVPTMPVVDADITAFPNVFALNSWDCSEITQVDGSFASNNCDAKSALMDEIYYEGTGDTTVVLVLKAGGNTDYNILLDDVSVLGYPTSIDNSSLNSTLNVFPNPVDNELNVSLANTIQEIEIVNVLGQRIYSAEDVVLKKVSIDFSGQASGIYLVVVTDTEGNKNMFKALKE